MSQNSLIRQRLLSSVAVNLIRQPVSLILSLVGSVIVARTLGPSLIAVLGVITATTLTVQTFADLGITKSVPKILADLSVQWGRDTAKQAVRHLLRLKFALVALGFALLLLLTMTGIWQLELEGLSLSALFFAIVGLRLLLTSWREIKAQEWVAALRVAKLSAVQVGAAVLTPLCTVAAALLWTDPYFVALAGLIPTALQLVLFYLMAGYDLDPHAAPVDQPPALTRSLPHLVARYGSYASTTYGLFLFNRLIFGLPLTLFLLTRWGVSAALVGQAVIAVSIVQRSWDVVNIPLASVRVPLLARIHAENQTEKLVYVQRLMVVVIVYTSALLCIAIVSVYDPLMGWLYGPEYALAIRGAVPLAALTVLFNIFSMGHIATQQVEQYRPVFVGFGLALVTIVLGIMLLRPLVDTADLPFVLIGAAVLGRGVFWLATDLWTDAAVFHWQGSEIKGRAIVALLLTLAAVYSLTTRYAGFMPRLFIGAGGALCFVALFRGLGGVGTQARGAIHQLLDQRIPAVLLKLI